MSRRGRRAYLAAVLLTLVVTAACGNAEPSRVNNNSPFSPYVALGDSYTAAPLVPSLQSNDGCYRSTHNYPSLVADDLDIGDFTDRSCGGARTEDLTDSQRFGVPPQLDALSEATRLVTVGIGGNDFKIAALMSTCVAARAQNTDGASCRGTIEAGGEDLLAAMPGVADNVAGVLRDVHRLAPDARVLVVGYPQIVPRRGACPELPMAAEDYAYFYRVNRALDRAVRTAARRTGDTFVDVWSASSGHDVCAAEPWVNGARTLPGKAAAMHPFGVEQRAVADLIIEKLRG